MANPTNYTNQSYGRHTLCSSPSSTSSSSMTVKNGEKIVSSISDKNIIMSPTTMKRSLPYDMSHSSSTTTPTSVPSNKVVRFAFQLVEQGTPYPMRNKVKQEEVAVKQEIENVDYGYGYDDYDYPTAEMLQSPTKKQRCCNKRRYQRRRLQHLSCWIVIVIVI